MHLAAADRQRGLVDDVAVGRDRARDDRLAETERALDHQLVAIARGGVDREHHARTRRGDLALHDDRNIHRRLAEAVHAPVVDRARAEQRAPAAADRVDRRHLRRECSGTSRSCPRTRRRRCPRRWRMSARPPGWRRAPASRPARTRSGSPRQRLGNRRLVEQLPSGSARRLQRGGVLDVDAVQQLGQARAQTRLLTERRVSGRADHKALGHGQTGGAQLTEVRALAASVVNIVASKRRKRAHQIERGLHGGCGRGVQVNSLRGERGKDGSRGRGRPPTPSYSQPARARGNYRKSHGSGSVVRTHDERHTRA